MAASDGLVSGYAYGQRPQEHCLGWARLILLISQHVAPFGARGLTQSHPKGARCLGDFGSELLLLEGGGTPIAP
jgi:hypothetical protein